MRHASLLARLAGNFSAKSSPANLQSRQLRLEPLEDRKLLTTSPVYVNDDWENLSFPDVPPQVGDLVTDDANDPGAIQAVYGVNAFGTGSGQSVAGYGLIRDAIANTNPGGQLNILAGTYAESDIVVNKAITISGAGQSGAEQTLIVPEVVSNQTSATSFGVSGTHNGFILYSTGITIEGLSLDGSGNGALAGGYHYHQGIATLYDTQNGGNVATLHDGALAPYNVGDDFSNPAELMIRDLTVSNTWFHGITISGTNGQVISTNTVQDVTVSNVGPLGSQDLDRIGILLQNVNQTQVLNSQVSAVGVGIASNIIVPTPAPGVVSDNHSGLRGNTVTDAVLRGYSVENARGQFSLASLLDEGVPFIGFDNNVAKFNNPLNNATGLYLNHSQALVVGFRSDGANTGMHIQDSSLDDATLPVITGSTFIGPGSGVPGSVGILAQNSAAEPGRVMFNVSAATTITGYEVGIYVNQIVVAANGPNVAQIDRPTIFGNYVGIYLDKQSVMYGSLQMTDRFVSSSGSTLTPGYPLSSYVTEYGSPFPVNFAGPQPGPIKAREFELWGGATFDPTIGPTTAPAPTVLFSFSNAATYDFQPLPPSVENGTIASQYSTGWDDGQVVQDGNGQLVIGNGAVNGPLRLLYGANAHADADVFAFDPIDIHDRTTVNIVAKAGATNESLGFLFGLVDYDGDVSAWMVPSSAFDSTAFSTHSINLLAPGIPLSLGGDGTFDLSRIVGYTIIGDGGLLDGNKATPFSLIVDEINASTFTSPTVQVAEYLSMNNAKLSGAVAPGFTPALGQQFTIIDYQSSEVNLGRFEGIAQSEFVILSGLSFRVNYSGGTGNDVVLTREELPPTVDIGVGSVTANEGNSGTTSFLFTVSLSSTSSVNVTVRYATSDGTALASSSDYTATSGTLTFTPGQTTKVVTVLVRGDRVVESNESFNLNLSNASLYATITGATGIGTIVNDDVANISVTNVTANEGNVGTTPFLFTVMLSNPSDESVTVQYATADGTATTADNDYAATSGTLTFVPGQTTRTVTVLVKGDIFEEPNETFTVNLSSATNATITGPVGTGTIKNEDPTSITIGNVTANEEHAGLVPFLFTVSLSNTKAAIVTVQYATANGTATTANNGYAATSGTLTFTPGQITQVVTVLVNGDTMPEPNEVFKVNLSAATNGTITGFTGTGTIVSDDGIPMTTIVGRRVFYNQSKFDGNSAGVNASDDLAIATDKVALLPGAGRATFAHITSYTRGINGVMVDLQGTHGTLTASDFIFKVGANNTPSTWAAALETPTITVRPGAGTGGSDRVEIIFTAANAPKNQWLQVIVKGNDFRSNYNTNTGLAVTDTFFFGNRVGEDGTGNANLAITTFVDEQGTRTHAGIATITNAWDFDRSGIVSATDGLASRYNFGTLLKINIDNASAAPEAAPAAATDIGIASALANKSLPKVDSLPAWVNTRLQKLDLAGLDWTASPIGTFITNLANSLEPRATALLNATDKLADRFAESSEFDDSLLDDLLADLKK